VWNPYSKESIENLEKVQVRATKLVYSIKHLDYEKRSKALKLPTLKYRRLRGDLIEVYKTISNYNEDVDCMFSFNNDSVTRGNRYKLFPTHVNFILKSISSPIALFQCGLSDQVVSAYTINSFKNKLDYFMFNQDMLYDWKADYDGTGSRSRTQTSFII
jgi:hypothetical protein